MTKTKEINLTPIQQKVFNFCEPIIQKAVEYHRAWARKMVEECRDTIVKKWAEAGIKFAGDIKHSSYDAYEFVERKHIGYDSELKSLLTWTIKRNACFIAGVHTPATDPAKVWIDERLYAKKMTEYEEDYRLWMTYKLKRSIEKYVDNKFTDIKNESINRGAKGFEIEAILIDATGKEFLYHTRAIGAGGYNIQEFHYRYITKIKEN